MNWTKLSSIAAVLMAAPATIAAPVAIANVPGCLPLNGTQLTANSHEDTNYLGITYDSNVTDGGRRGGGGSPIVVTVCNQ